MNENRIQQVLEVERQAQEIHEKAKREAHEIPMKAEQAAQALIVKARSEAQDEARKLIAAIQVENASGQPLDVESANSDIEAKAKKNFDKAVAFVLERVIGRA